MAKATSDEPDQSPITRRIEAGSGTGFDGGPVGWNEASVTVPPSRVGRIERETHDISDAIPVSNKQGLHPAQQCVCLTQVFNGLTCARVLQDLEQHKKSSVAGFVDWR